MRLVNAYFRVMTYFGPAIVDIAVCVEDEKIDLIYLYAFHQIDAFFLYLEPRMNSGSLSFWNRNCRINKYHLQLIFYPSYLV